MTPDLKDLPLPQLGRIAAKTPGRKVKLTVQEYYELRKRVVWLREQLVLMKRAMWEER